MDVRIPVLDIIAPLREVRLNCIPVPKLSAGLCSEGQQSHVTHYADTVRGHLVDNKPDNHMAHLVNNIDESYHDLQDR